ncbi:MAG: caspase family protein [Chitinophagaceae bacterium]|nr:MAG: caspase family protein [Chitinophagaceae bacterium]
MKNLLQFLLFFSVFLYSTPIFSQNKYALLIGINKYYSSPNVLHTKQLRGCVNDANAIKGMLIKRFGFPDNDNIILLTDKNANREMVENAIQTILLKVKPGDAFVFYFSGHGVWMNNINQNEFEQKLKMGMNQALVLSNLYAANLKCLFRDADVKQMFNKFVDKKVIATGIFDCCFSGHISQGQSIDFHNSYSYFLTHNSQRSFSFADIVENFKIINDSIAKFDNPKWDTILAQFIEDSIIHTKAFNMGDSIAINDSRLITRPSERPHSNFLSLSGTDEYQKGEEMKDATGQYHGVFTKSLLDIIEKNPTDISVKDLFDKTKKLIVAKGFKQTPLRFQDPSRVSNNLIGMQSDQFNNNIECSVKSIQKNKIILDAGTIDGLKIGNVLSLKRNKKLT